jgi:Domain of unknown function (DUF4129)
MTRRLRPLPIYLLVVAMTGTSRPVAPAGPPPQQGATLDLPGYLAALDRCSWAASRLIEHPAEAPALKGSLPEDWAVVVDGQSFMVSTDWLRQRLDSFPTERSQAAERSRQILARLRAMRDAAAALGEAEGAGGVNPTEARRSLDRILQQPEFARSLARSPLQAWWDRVANWLEARLDFLFGRLETKYRLPSSVLWVLAIGTGLVLLGWLIRSILRVSRRPARYPSRAVEVAADWQEWAGKAVASARRGEFREAIHMAYRAALYRLQDAGLWQVEEARTPREYLTLLPASCREYAPVKALTFRFERSWYGGRAASADDFQRVVTELKDLGCPLDWNPATANS